MDSMNRKGNQRAVPLVNGVRLGVTADNSYYQQDENPGERTVRRKGKNRVKGSEVRSGGLGGDNKTDLLSDFGENQQLYEAQKNAALSKSHLVYQNQQNAAASMPPHLKKASLEYDKLMQQAAQKRDEVFGQNYIYNLKPLKDIIVNTIQQQRAGAEAQKRQRDVTTRAKQR